VVQIVRIEDWVQICTTQRQPKSESPYTSPSTPNSLISIGLNMVHSMKSRYDGVIVVVRSCPAFPNFTAQARQPKVFLGSICGKWK